MYVYALALILDGNLEHVAQARRIIGLFVGKNPICDCSRSDRIPQTEQITEIVPYVRVYF